MSIILDNNSHLNALKIIPKALNIESRAREGLGAFLTRGKVVLIERQKGEYIGGESIHH